MNPSPQLLTKQQRYWRRNREKISAQRKKKYRECYAEARRVKKKGDKRCRACEILLASHLGGKGVKVYCRDCVDRGFARKHMNLAKTKRYYLRNRERINAHKRFLYRLKKEKNARESYRVGQLQGCSMELLARAL